VPKIFNPPFLTDEWAMTAFHELNGKQWPLKSATDRLFVLLILTNPFQIAREFYDVIQEIGRCVQRVLIHQNVDAKFVELDFDQVFTLILVCIFASGLTELTQVMTYSFGFREFVKSDPHLQYAMSHMEGVCAHLGRLDYTELRKKSAAIVAQYSATVADPLGIMRSV
jgi:hypothetical protein